MIPHVEIYITQFQIQQLCPHMQTPPWSRFVGYLQSLLSCAITAGQEFLVIMEIRNLFAY